MVMLVACAKFIHVHTTITEEDHSHQCLKNFEKKLELPRKHPCCTFSVHTTERQIGCRLHRPICSHTDQNLMRA